MAAKLCSQQNRDWMKLFEHYLFWGTYRTLKKGLGMIVHAHIKYKIKNIFIAIIIIIIITLIIIVSKSDWCHHVDKLRAKSTKPVESFKRGFVEETFIIILPHHWIIISSDRHIVNSPCRYFLFTNMFLWIFQKARQSKWQGHSKYENKCHLLWQSLFKSYFQLQQNDQWMAHFK